MTTDGKKPDAIDEAIARQGMGAEPPAFPALQNSRKLPATDTKPLRMIELKVPEDFDAEDFETAVAMLFELRAASMQVQETKAHSGLVLPSKPRLLRPT